MTNSLYTVYKFINNGTIAFSTNQNINYCIVGGGNCGSNGIYGNGGNGGNGGGVVQGTMTTNNCNITIGDGGGQDINGTPSTINTITTDSGTGFGAGGIGSNSDNNTNSAIEGRVGTQFNIGTTPYYVAGGGGGGTSGNDAYVPATITNLNYGVGFGGGPVAYGNANNNGLANYGGGGSGGGIYKGGAIAPWGQGGSGVCFIWF